jgi:hypothetical protein
MPQPSKLKSGARITVHVLGGVRRGEFLRYVNTRNGREVEVKLDGESAPVIVAEFAVRSEEPARPKDYNRRIATIGVAVTVVGTAVSLATLWRGGDSTLTATTTVTATRTTGASLTPGEVSVSVGQHKNLVPCTSQACAFVVVTTRDFEPGYHVVVCYSADPPPSGAGESYYRYDVSIPVRGVFSSSVCVYGLPHGVVWATVDGVESDRITWP